MICTFCGTENREENRFCGMCGVRLERRKMERRANATDGANTECSSCGHINDPGYKFCGMCGYRIDRRTLDRRGAPEKRRATAMANAQLPTPESRRGAREIESRSSQTATMVAPPSPERQSAASHAADHSVASMSVSGPSFLGLNDASAAGGEYLLEDERSSGRGLRMFLLLVVLVAIAGLIFVQYRANLKGSRSPELPKPEPAGLPRPAGDNRMPAILKNSGTAVAASVVQAKAAAASRASPGDTDEKTAAAEAPKKKAGREQAAGRQQADDAGSDADPAPSTPNKPSAALVKAQQYLHGQGVRQNCEQGLVYLKVATQENDPAAAVQMGALYASGFCVQQNRVKAYQWFTTAREMEPNNRWLTKNLDQLWAQMTPQERRQIH